MLFKGGTSLSKAFGLITRFSEDIDITIFRSDLGFAVDVPELNLLSSKQRRLRPDAIRAACQTYIAKSIAVQFRALAAARLKSRFRLEPDPADKGCQTLLFWYPVVAPSAGDYVRAVVKIEFGAKSALDPHVATIILETSVDRLQLLGKPCGYWVLALFQRSPVW